MDELVEFIAGLSAEAVVLQSEVRAYSETPTLIAINKLQALTGLLELAGITVRSIAKDLHRHARLRGVICSATKEHLSTREREVLRLLSKGLTVSQIAKQRALSVKTVSTYRARVLRKLAVATTAELMRYGITHKLD